MPVTTNFGLVTGFLASVTAFFSLVTYAYTMGSLLVLILKEKTKSKMKQDSPFVMTKGHAPSGLSCVAEGDWRGGGAFSWLRQPPALRCLPLAVRLRRAVGRTGRKARRNHAIGSVCATWLLTAGSARGASVFPTAQRCRIRSWHGRSVMAAASGFTPDDEL